MKQPSQAAFRFETYQIKRFSFKVPEAANSRLSMRFSPAAVYREQEGQMTLNLTIALKEEPELKEAAIELSLEALFLFDTAPALSDLPDYFYKNSIAILYPYIRAFITTLTATANISPLILPLLNLSHLEQELRANVSVE